MGDIDAAMNEAATRFGNDLIELIKAQVLEETAKALGVEAPKSDWSKERGLRLGAMLGAIVDAEDARDRPKRRKGVVKDPKWLKQQRAAAKRFKQQQAAERISVRVRKTMKKMRQTGENTIHARVFNYVTEHPNETSKTIAKKLKLLWPTTRRTLNELAARGKIKKTPDKGWRRFNIDGS